MGFQNTDVVQPFNYKSQYFHINAVAPFEDGYVISARHFSTVVFIDKDGEVTYRLNVSFDGFLRQDQGISNNSPRAKLDKISLSPQTRISDTSTTFLPIGGMTGLLS